MSRADMMGLISTYKKGEYRRVIENDSFYDLRNFRTEKYEELDVKDKKETIKSLVFFYKDMYKYLKRECKSDNLYLSKSVIGNCYGKYYRYSLNVGLCSLVDIFFLSLEREYKFYELKLKRIIKKYERLFEKSYHKSLFNNHICPSYEENEEQEFEDNYYIEDDQDYESYNQKEENYQEEQREEDGSYYENNED